MFRYTHISVWLKKVRDEKLQQKPGCLDILNIIFVYIYSNC